MIRFILMAFLVSTPLFAQDPPIEQRLSQLEKDMAELRKKVGTLIDGAVPTDAVFWTTSTDCRKVNKLTLHWNKVVLFQSVSAPFTCDGKEFLTVRILGDDIPAEYRVLTFLKSDLIISP